MHKADPHVQVARQAAWAKAEPYYEGAAARYNTHAAPYVGPAVEAAKPWFTWGIDMAKGAATSASKAVGFSRVEKPPTEQKQRPEVLDVPDLSVTLPDTQYEKERIARNLQRVRSVATDERLVEASPPMMEAEEVDDAIAPGKADTPTPNEEDLEPHA